MPTAVQPLGDPQLGDPLGKESAHGLASLIQAGDHGLNVEDHLKVIGKIERAVRTGGLFAMAMPRGSGKTVGCQTAVLWAALIRELGRN